MKAIIDTYELKRIIKATKGFVSKNDDRPALQWIRLDFDKETGKVKASALDGFMLSVEFAPLIELDESFYTYIKPYLPIGIKSDYIEISVGNEFCNIVEKAGYYSIRYKQPQIKWLDTDKIVFDLEKEEIVASIYIDNKKLADMLKSIDTNGIQKPTIIEFRGENKPVMLKYGSGTRMLQVISSK